ncbi:FAD-binding oxidoreductase [Bradyrhizobium jicamae]|uniref:FAD-dependent oxidoreductase n=1 Tax=Bradyrhizobium jicamae TaxID=280332 RepID=UPI001BA46E56|nr:FAD-binding oxidoreductase [Bradyrhizobium jicamae]MBR0754352.1 FAD-binding oxidoreductase [Bradyrhizobium jicamae]
MIAEKHADSLASLQLKGQLLRYGGQDYAESRAIFNMRRSETRPSVIVRAADADDVAMVMSWASRHRQPIGIRSGGHGADGAAMPDRVPVLDLTRLRDVHMDKANGRVKVGAGLLLGDIDRIGQDHGLVVPSGTVSDTGVAGLTLGGGVGMLMRRFGATVDNLINCDVVSTDGRKIVASESENADLFWALRGGGGNFGVVTAFEYRGYPVGPTVTAGFVVFPLDQAASILRKVGDSMSAIPREVGLVCSIVECPPMPPVPVQHHHRHILLMTILHSGELSLANDDIHKVISFGRPIVNMVTPMPWVQANSMFNVFAPTGRRTHQRGAYLSELRDETIALMLHHAVNAAQLDYVPPVPATAQSVWLMGGAITDDFAEDSKAFSREGARFFWEAVSQWDKPEDDGRLAAWADAVADAISPYARKNCYVNLSTDRGPEWIREIYGSEEKFQRLLSAKAKWDPHNILRFNKNFAIERRATQS